MENKQTDATDIGVDEQLSETFNSLVLLANPVPVAEQEVEPKTEDYQKNEPKEGACYIFNYLEFEKKAKNLPSRNGSQKDAARLKHDFMQLNLEVYLYENLSYDETLDVLKAASNKDYSNSKYFVCCFLTHGGQNGVLWTKDGEMYIDKIFCMFSESSSLKGVPKIFIIQACRGKKTELAVSTDSTDSVFSPDDEDYLDFLIINSTYVDTFSFRTTEEQCHGSFFVDEFCCCMEKYSNILDLLQILTIANYRMATMFLSHLKDNRELDKKKQMPCFYTTLRKKVEFNRNIKPFFSEDTQWFDKRRKRHGSGHDNAYGFQSNIYNIKKALFLSVVNKKIGKTDSGLRSAIDLVTVFASRRYSHKTFRGNFKRSKILQFLDQNGNQSETRNESEVDCLVCYIAAYSRNGVVLDADGRKIRKPDIIGKFIGQLNKSFVGKPKIFIFLLRKLLIEEDLSDEEFCENVEPTVATRINSETNGSKFHSGTDSIDGDTEQSIDSSDREFNANSESSDVGCVGENLIPIHADILEICITIADWKQATRAMNSFQEILKKNSAEDFLSLLTEFNSQLVEKHNFFKMPSSFSVTSTLTKTLFLP